MKFQEIIACVSAIQPPCITAVDIDPHFARWEYLDDAGDVLIIKASQWGNFTIGRPSNSHENIWNIDGEFAQWLAILSGLLKEVEK